MRIDTTPLPGVLLIKPARHGDARGFFSETYRASALAEAGAPTSFVQDNLARSAARGVVRGLHFQKPPFAQAKLVRVSRGAIYDAVVDIRTGSVTYGRSFGTTLDEDEGLQLYVPEGFAHGYCTLTEAAEVVYKVSAPYAPEHEGGLLWNDPALGIDWPVTGDVAVLNARDRAWPTLQELTPG